MSMQMRVEELRGMTKVEVKAIAKELGIWGISSSNKEEVISKIIDEEFREEIEMELAKEIARKEEERKARLVAQEKEREATTVGLYSAHNYRLEKFTITYGNNSKKSYLDLIKVSFDSDLKISVDKDFVSGLYVVSLFVSSIRSTDVSELQAYAEEVNKAVKTFEAIKTCVDAFNTSIDRFNTVL